MKKLGIYIHIPFCRQKCNYCDFYSMKWNDESEKKYIKALTNEIKTQGKELKDNYIANTIYFGGGTPTIIKHENIKEIIDSICETMEIDKCAEISIEANPNTLTLENLNAYRDMGINRLSIGIQSLNDEILRQIGRIHNSAEALDAIDRALESGFENINADVMFNIPGQNVCDIEETITKIINRGVKHISFYSLKLEKGTPMYNMEKINKIIMPDEESEREMYYAGRKIMESNNMFQYEISNFSNRGYECRHNLKYWEQEEYVGFGPSAHSFINSIRYSNPPDLKSYCENGLSNNYERIIHEKLSDQDRMFEYIMLRLRLTEGLNLDEFNNKFGISFEKAFKVQIERMINNLLMEYSGRNVRLTEKGMDISNYVIEEFLP
ncbi:MULTISPECIES: radical SAM family heme chaperone HemW [unclassified Sedimentibacter]|uniref:radical SAM family heme chaperone HemW n=1 Tax=unclassified Sedimentibacter TaxID=2649220 RepID=UPI0027E0DA49|nr:radical SAM family heme chaperone HemW [Sedimentibacter sp. MB35-C1]WMJ76683.1 radical SAM family heme chaperone HemW [Sedimentibacter sp. MB35-C1]